jgi:bacterioferritin-associated ferredoxin
VARAHPALLALAGEDPAQVVSVIVQQAEPSAELASVVAQGGSCNSTRSACRRTTVNKSLNGVCGKAANTIQTIVKAIRLQMQRLPSSFLYSFSSLSPLSGNSLLT